MSGRTFVVIFIFWALLTIITPTLIHLSNSAKHESNSQGDWRTYEIKARKMVGHIKNQLLISPRDQYLKAVSRAQAPGPAPGKETGKLSKKLGSVFSSIK
ncbi:hypothetical protein SAY87_021597 [Trapa incisa]|uniref:Uncharacterized protein n=1 Tax=Trapa incisa TaxID=236973 RepID=A0AAN7JS66_9MYRT|nr:hypothetical protein SAY87_021597 [Trapa incisa]